MRHRVKKAFDLNVIVEPDPRETPIGKLPVGVRQGLESRSLDALEQFAPAHAQPSHRAIVHAIEHAFDRRIDFGKREEGLVPKSTENVACANRTPASTLALSLGFLGRAGSTPTP